MYILTSTCASHQNGVQCFISHPHPPLQRAYFSTLRSHKSLEKHSDSRLFYLFAHLHLLSSDPFSSIIFLLLLCSSLTLPTSAFSSVHTVGSLTSKLPSIITILYYKQIYVYLCTYIHSYTSCTSHHIHLRIPVVPHKAVAEVSD